MRDSAFTTRPLLFPSSLGKARDETIFPQRSVFNLPVLYHHVICLNLLSSRGAQIQRSREPTPRSSPGALDNTTPSGCVSEPSFLLWGEEHSRDCLPGEQNLPCAQPGAEELPKQGLNRDIETASTALLIWGRKGRIYRRLVVLLSHTSSQRPICSVFC